MPWVPISPSTTAWSDPFVLLMTESSLVITTEDGVALATEQSVVGDPWTPIPITETT